MLRWSVFVALTLCGAVAHAQPAPILERITATTSALYDTTIRGAAGAVTPSSLVAVMNLHTGHYTIVEASGDGAFEARLFAPGGSSVLIKADPERGNLRDQMDGKYILGERGEMIGLAGTVVQVPDPAAASGAATMSALMSLQRLPVWVAEARTDKSVYSRADAVTVEGTYMVLGSAEAGQTPEVDVILTLVGLTRPDGRGTLDQSTYCSAVMTPTGLPIERASFAQAGDLAKQTVILQSAGDRLQAAFRLTAPSIPLDVADGYYRPMVIFVTRGIALSQGRRVGVAERIDSANRRRLLNDRPYGLLPVVRIGNAAPPRLYWTLLIDTMSQGARGVTAVEDRDRFAVASRIAVSSDRFVVPRTDPRTETAIRYNLEPAALTVAVSNVGVPMNWPTIPFRFPSGNLTVSVKRPNGETAVIGPAPFRQARLIGVKTPRGQLDANYMTDPFRLTTLDPRFDVTFLEDGPHEISVAGTIEDLWGNVWSSGGTYVVDVARPLEIDSALIPGTPLEVGDAINPSVHLWPAVPGDVEVRYRFAPGSRRDLMTERTFRVRANAHGYAHLDAIPVADPGEYRIDITASFHDSTGRLWFGTRTWGSVVAGLAPPIDLHGMRGVDDQPAPRLAWFSRKQIGLSKDTSGHVHFPFHSGDVMWMADDDSTTMAMKLHDRNRLLTSLLPHREEQVVAGEMSFYSVGPNGVDPHLATTTDNELWAYAYRFVERPRVRVREMISEDTVQRLYWRFDDRYALQSGTGDKGDLPNDFKFQFGGVALYGRALSSPIYSIYGSLFVLIANDDPEGTRVFPPFQSQGGGPLFTLKNRPIEMFFHPTAVHPGTILDVGQVASFAGQIGPTLPSKVEIVVTSPSGVCRTITGQANSIGYFYRPASDFVVNEPGVWRARVRVWHEGRTSAGPVTPPFPAGDVLGSREGEFYFYAVNAGAKLALTPMPQLVSDSGPLAFTVIPPPALTDIEIYYTTTMPGFLLEEGKLSGLTYRFDPARLSRNFPNLDYDEANQSPAVETITVSLSPAKTRLAQRDSSRDRSCCKAMRS
jgi:hypothetical protein